MNEPNVNPISSSSSDDPYIPDQPQPQPVSQLAPPAFAPVTGPIYSSPPPTNAWAIISLISSILSWLGLFGIGGIIGVVAGVIARNEIAAGKGAQTGDGMALTGIILGAVNIVGACLLALCFLTFLGGMSLMFGSSAGGR